MHALVFQKSINQFSNFIYYFILFFVFYLFLLLFLFLNKGRSTDEIVKIPTSALVTQFYRNPTRLTKRLYKKVDFQEFSFELFPFGKHTITFLPNNLLVVNNKSVFSNS